MISANEFRIGNWVKYLNGFYKITGITRSGIYLETSFGEEILGYHIFDVINPIPLTPEILEKCGFEKDEFKMFDNENCYFVCQNSEVNLWVESYYKIGNAKSLHQLQNLYFALTGTELIINL